MLCPICHSEDIGTARTIQESWGVKRLRKCRRCCHEWTTAELRGADIAELQKVRAKALELAREVFPEQG
jgi:transcriptional regulator NrdR family protein